jgi:hypothetical protein
MAAAESERLDGNLRDAAAVADVLPWKSTLVAIIRYRGGKVAYAKRVGEKRAMGRDVRPRDRYVVAWPGQWSQDVFAATPSLIRQILESM